jgi:hypothetical protein
VECRGDLSTRCAVPVLTCRDYGKLRKISAQSMRRLKIGPMTSRRSHHVQHLARSHGAITHEATQCEESCSNNKEKEAFVRS